MAEAQSIQWFPGHMAKTRRKIQEDIKLVDVVAELLDARVPQSSSNPVLRDIIQRKPKVVLLNKSDMADPVQTSKWVSYYASQGEKAIPLESKTGKGLSAFYPTVREVLKPQIEAWEKKGMVGRPIRVMVVGIPNVGKSSFINRMILGGGAGKAAVQDRPGVTRQNRWFTVGKGFELLDTPGVLWPKFEDPIVGEHLAFTGAVRDEILDEFLDFIQDEEHAILLSSHITSDLEKVADYVTYLHRGKVAVSGAKDELLDTYGRLVCSRADLEQVDPALLVGVRTGQFGCEALVKDKHAFVRFYPGLTVDPVTLEDIMVFTVKGDAK